MAEKKIGKAIYRVDKLAASQSLRLLTQLTKMLGPAIGDLSAAASATDPETRDASALRAISALASALPEDEMVAFVVKVASHAQVQVNGAWEPVVFDHHFDGDLIAAFQVVAFVIEVQFGDFFGGNGVSQLTRRIMTPTGRA